MGYAAEGSLRSRDDVAQSNSDGNDTSKDISLGGRYGACRLTLRVGVSRWNACLTKDQVYKMCGNACCLIYAYTPLHPARAITCGSHMKKNVDPPQPPLPMNISDMRDLRNIFSK